MSVPAEDVGSDPEFLPFARPSITEREKKAVMDVLNSGWLTTGPRSREFEERFAEMVGTRHAIALNSATAALHLALEAFGVGEDDEVIVPTWTFAASAEVVAYLGARPVLVDCDAATLNATPEGILAAVTPKTKAVIVVHVAGRPLDIGRLVELLDAAWDPHRRGRGTRLPDADRGFWRSLRGHVREGRAPTRSTRRRRSPPAKGGMFVTDDQALADRVRLMSLHGISRNAWNRYAASGSWYYEIEDVGYKYNMTDLAAALGLVQLDRAEELLEARRTLAAGYTRQLTASQVADLIDLPSDTPDGSHAWHLYVIRLHTDRLRIDRGEVIDRLKGLGIGTSVHFIPLHLHPYYVGKGFRAEDFPIATREYERVISLPIWPGMSGDDVDRVVSGLEGVLGSARR